MKVNLKQVIGFFCIAALVFTLHSRAIADAVLPVTPLGPDLLDVVGADKWRAADPDNSPLAYDSAQEGFPFFIKGDGKPNHNGMAELIQAPYTTFNLTGGKFYQFVLRMKADQFPQGQTINFKAESTGGDDYESSGTSTWNVSRAEEWEEVYLPVHPQKDLKWHVQVWMIPLTSFASTPTTIYIAPDVDLYELPTGQEVGTLHEINTATDKDSFVSSTQRVDGLGNIYTKDEDSSVWKHVFPRMIYRDNPPAHHDGTTSFTVEEYRAVFQRYKDYGFTGVIDIRNRIQAQASIDVGLEHLSIGANCCYATFESTWPGINDVYQWAAIKDQQGKNHQGNVLWYYVDNENNWVGDYDYQKTLQEHIDANHKDPQTGKRRHPIYFLNGNVGVPRTYHNASRTVMDFTGSYVGSDSENLYADLDPEPTLLVEFMSQNQRAPVNFIELQIGIGKTFIPSLFYGIIQGGRAICIWRDGGPTKAEDGTKIEETPIEDTSWAAAFRDDVSPKIDQMLPLIEQPHFTSWKAWTDQYPKVRIGTRELNGADYLLFSSFAESDLPVTVTLQDLEVAAAVDMFTGVQIATVENGTFQFNLGHYNNGYRVIRLSSVSFLSAQAEELTSTSAQIHFVLNRKAQAQIEYGLTTGYGSWTTKEISFKYAEHLQPLTGLRPNTTYHYRVHTWDEDGNEVISEDQTFTTSRGFNWLLVMPALFGRVPR